MSSPERKPNLHQSRLSTFLTGSKRKETSPKASSPSNINGSPLKRANVEEDSNKPKLEISPHELTPSIITPVRDKMDIEPEEPHTPMQLEGTEGGEEGEEENQSRKQITEETATDDAQPNIDAKRQEAQPVASPVTENLQGSEVKKIAAPTGNQEKPSNPEVQNPYIRVERHRENEESDKRGKAQITQRPTQPTKTAKREIKSVLKNAFVTVATNAAKKGDPPPILQRWKAHRLACMFDIKMPVNKSKRTAYLSRELNAMLKTVKIYAKQVYVRKYAEFASPKNGDTKTWIEKFDSDKVSDLSQFTCGFYANQQLRDGTFRLLVQVILPVATDIPELLINVNNHKWAGSKNRSLRDIREQHLHAPKYVGWLFRSNYSMVGSNDLQQEFEMRAGIHFGLTFKSVPLPVPGKYNKDTAIKAVCENRR